MPTLSLRRSFATAALAAAFAGCSGSPRGADPEPTPPSPLASFRAPTVRTEQVVDDYHGEPIPDPYRWLEDQDGDEVAEFVAAQNTATRAVLDAIPQRGPIEERLRELWNYARREPPVRRGERRLHHRVRPVAPGVRAGELQRGLMAEANPRLGAVPRHVAAVHRQAVVRDKVGVEHRAVGGPGEAAAVDHAERVGGDVDDRVAGDLAVGVGAVQHRVPNPAAWLQVPL